MTERKKPGMKCPHCGTRAIIRTSEALTDQASELRYECQNLECGFAWVAQLSIVHAVRPSARPNPNIRIPLSAAFRPNVVPSRSDLGRLVVAAGQALDGSTTPTGSAPKANAA